MHQLKGRAVRGGVAKLLNQLATTGIRILFLVVLARYLGTGDFGLVAMATVVTGFLDRFTHAGLSSATIQRQEISDQQVSHLFWVNVLVGAFLAAVCASFAPLIARFYDDPRLIEVILVLASGFIFAALGVQHSALLERDLRYTTLSTIDTVSQLGSAALGIGLAFAGWGYWSLVIAGVAAQGMYSAGCWLASGWVPKRPRSGVEIRPMLSFGGVVMLNSIVVYVGYNMEKVLLGRFLGADTLGLYTRAAQLIGIPVNTINGIVGGLFFSVLSRLQDDPDQFRSFFLKGYSIIIALSVPSTLFAALFADEIILLILGPNWSSAVPIFRLMTPTILVLGIINPMAWVLMSTGRQKRSLYIGIVVSLLVLVANLIGLRYGATGVAFSYSAVMLLWSLPHVAWCLHGTPISLKDLAKAIWGPFIASIAAVVCAHTLSDYVPPDHALLRLLLGATIMTVAYGWILLFLIEERSLYRSALVSLRSVSAPKA
jgi:PST family polysaccharide transporter